MTPARGWTRPVSAELVLDELGCTIGVIYAADATAGTWRWWTLGGGGVAWSRDEALLRVTQRVR